MKRTTMGIVLACCLLSLAGCRARPPAAPAALPEPAPEVEEEPEPEAPEPSPELGPPTAEQMAAVRGQRAIRAELVTEKGTIRLELDGSAAPEAVANFVNLVQAGFYDDMAFHRVEPGFVVQVGDPQLAGRPAVGYTIRDERSPIEHTRGAVAMARLYQAGQMVPNSASTQFYICLGDAPHLDAMGFTAFGRVVEGMEVVDAIAVGDKILTASVTSPPRGG